jgi:hypothetical protein
MVFNFQEVILALRGPLNAPPRQGLRECEAFVPALEAQLSSPMPFCLLRSRLQACLLQQQGPPTIEGAVLPSFPFGSPATYTLATQLQLPSVPPPPVDASWFQFLSGVPQAQSGAKNYFECSYCWAKHNNCPFRTPVPGLPGHCCLCQVAIPYGPCSSARTLPYRTLAAQPHTSLVTTVSYRALPAHVDLAGERSAMSNI